MKVLDLFEKIEFDELPIEIPLDFPPNGQRWFYIDDNLKPTYRTSAYTDINPNLDNTNPKLESLARKLILKAAKSRKFKNITFVKNGYEILIVNSQYKDRFIMVTHKDKISLLILDNYGIYKQKVKDDPSTT